MDKSDDFMSEKKRPQAGGRKKDNMNVYFPLASLLHKPQTGTG